MSCPVIITYIGESNAPLFLGRLSCARLILGKNPFHKNRENMHFREVKKARGKEIGIICIRNSNLGKTFILRGKALPNQEIENLVQESIS